MGDPTDYTVEPGRAGRFYADIRRYWAPAARRVAGTTRLCRIFGPNCKGRRTRRPRILVQGPEVHGARPRESVCIESARHDPRLMAIAIYSDGPRSSAARRCSKVHAECECQRPAAASTARHRKFPNSANCRSRSGGARCVNARCRAWHKTADAVLTVQCGPRCGNRSVLLACSRNGLTL